MRRYSLTLRKPLLALAATVVASLGVATSAQAVVVTDGGVTAGVSLVPTARELGSTTQGYLTAASIPRVTDPIGTPCADPAAATEPDILTAGSWPLTAPGQPLCWHSGPVMHSNETFTLEWEGQAPNTYWSSTKQYVQSFLHDVGVASGQLVNPYSDTTQYWDNNVTQAGVPSSARAAYSSVFGGGCDDNGTANCKFGTITGSGPGNALPSGTTDCTATGDNIFGGVFAGGTYTIPNNVCVNDASIRNEVKSLVDNDHLIEHTQPGRTPLVTVLTPPGVVVCLDAANNLCSANSLVAPPPPVLSSADTGGHVTAGAYQVVITYSLSGGGESAPSAPSSITTTGSTSTLTIAAPPDHAGTNGWYAYVTGPNGFIYRKQNPGGSGALQQPDVDLTLTDPPTTGGQPPTGKAAFCSYHAQVTDPQTNKPISYVVQPWSAFSVCDEPDVPTVAPWTPPSVIETSAGQRLASPISQSSMAAIVNPQLTGWYGNDGLEIDDQNACQPEGHGLDTFNFGDTGQGSYYLQREANNATVVDSDPWTYNGCLPNDVLNPAFAIPSSIGQGDTVQLDGSATASSLAIPNGNYSWNFGDGATGTGPSVSHTFTKTSNVTLTVTDRGGNTATVTQTITVLGPDGQPLAPGASSPAASPSSGSGSGSGSAGSSALSARLLLLPQSLKAVLKSGIAVRVTSNKAANGIASVSITRATARKAGIKVGKAPSVRIGLGTVASITNGTVTLRLHLSPNVAKKLSHLHYVTLTVRLALVAAGNERVAVDVAGRY